MITPDASGRCVAFSLKEAQSSSLFRLVLPMYVPDSLKLEVLILYRMASGPIDAEDCEDSDYVEAWYAMDVDDQRPPPIKFIQTTSRPSFQGRDAESLNIAGKDVTKYSSSVDTNTTLLYSWQGAEISYVLQVPRDASIQEEDLRTMIESIASGN